MLRCALSQVPSGEGEEKNREAEFHTLHIQTRGITVSTKEDNQGGESKVSSPCGKKRAASEESKTEVPKQGKKTSLGGLALKGVLTAPCPQTGQPSTSCKLIVNKKILLPPPRTITRISRLQSG